MAQAFSIKSDEILKLEDQLYRVAEKAIPYATRNTVNKGAFVGMRIARHRVKKQFTTRNKWTQGSIRVKTTKTLNIPHQEALLGSTEAYMEDQEFGAIKRRKGKRGVPIPTGYASGEGKTPTPRKRLPRGRNKLNKITLSRKRGGGKTKKQQTVVRIRQAVKTGNRYVYLDTNRTKGIFRVIGGTKKNPQNARIEMVYDLRRMTVRIPKDPWLYPSVQKTIPHIPKIYKESLEFQLRRLNLLQR